MISLPSNFVTIEWLIPLFNEELSHLQRSWDKLAQETSADAWPDFADMTARYHELSGALHMAELPAFLPLTQSLELLSQQLISDREIRNTAHSSGAFANALLQGELNHYAITGDIRHQFLVQCNQKVVRLLPATISTASAQMDTQAFPNILFATQWPIPETLSRPLMAAQYSLLLKAWRQSVRQLLLVNSNEAQYLAPLQKITHYLWQASNSQVLRAVWYLSKIWLDNLGDNEHPTPSQYAGLLAQLDQVLQVLSQLSAEVDSALIDSQMLNEVLQGLTIEGVVAQVCIHLSALTHNNSAAKVVLSAINTDTESAQRFLPRILSKLETAVFDPQQPLAIVPTLSDIRRLLHQRGWSLYERDIDHIITDIKRLPHAADGAGQLQQQIEQQLQAFTTTILNAHDTIVNKIGQTRTFAPSLEAAESDSAHAPYHSQPDTVRQLRIAVEGIKSDFNSYLQQGQTACLPSADKFTAIQQDFIDIQLHEVADVSAQIARLFAQLQAAELTKLPWSLVNAIAESLASLELFLDYLAQQVFDQNLLEQLQAHIEVANGLVNKLIADPDASDIDMAALFSSELTAADNVTRYDDSGEIIAINSEQQASSIEIVPAAQATASLVEDSLAQDSLVEQATTEAVGTEDLVISAPSVCEDSEALIAARATLKDDNFDMDEEIREIFVEEAEEVLEQLDQYLPQWAHAPQDFTPLAEIRRGFHTLKGSGRMVGAFNAGEMAWAVEDMLNRVLDKTVPVTDELIAFIRETKDLIPTLVDDFANLRKPSIDPAITVLKAKNILAGQPINQGLAAEGQPEVKMLSSTEANNDSASSLEHAAATDADLAVTDALEDSGDSHDIDSASSLAPEQLTDINTNKDTDIANNSIATDPMMAEFPEVLAPFMSLDLPNDIKDTDPDIKEIFIEEADEVLATIMPKFAQYQTELAQHSDDIVKNSGKLSAEAQAALLEVRRGFHTLKGSGRMVGANHSAELAWAVEDMLNRILEHTLAPTADMLALVADVVSAYPALLSIYEAGTNDYPEEVALWAACANAYSKGLGKQFSYAVAKKQNVATTEQADNQGAAPEIDSKIDALQADSLAVFTRINEQLVAAPVVLQPKNEEEKAFFDVFMEEAQERLETIKNFVKTHQTASEVMVDDEIVRAFHTLKGASGTQSLTTISKISSTIEHSLEQLQQHDAAMRPQHLQALEQAVGLIESRLATYQRNHLQGIANLKQDDSEQELLEAQVNSTDLQSIQDILGESDSQSGEDELSVAQLIQDDIDDLLDAEWELESHLSEQNVTNISAYALIMTEQIKRLLASTISLSKFQKLLTALLAVYERLTTDPELAWQDEVVDGLLAGHGELTGLFDALAGSISLKLNETVVDELIHIAQLSASPSLSQQTSASGSALAQLQSNQVEEEVIANLGAKSQAVAMSELELEPINTDAELLEIFLEEAQELDADINNIFTTWVEAPNNMEALKALQRHLHTIKGGARMAGIKSLGDLTHEAETVYEYFVGGKLTPSQGWVNVMQGIQDTMSAQIDYLVQHQQSFYATDLVEALQNFISMGTLPEDAKVSLPLFRTVAAEATTSEADSETELDTDLKEHDEDESSADQPEHNYSEMVAQSWAEEQPDPDILAVFLAEARELDNSIREHMQSFISNTSDVVALQSLQGNLHRLKGGARMVSANGMADLAHQMEAVFEALASRRRPATKLVIQLLIDCQDWLTDAIFVISHHINPPAPAKMTAALESFNENPDSLQEVMPASLQSQIAAIAEHEAMLKAASEQRDISKMPLMTGGFDQGETASDTTNEMIRIPSGLIERMINLSGESAINRARIDMGMSSLTNSIEEMGITVQRLSDQLRRMDIELEVQILSQIDEEEILDNADFDPLEMDQYSALNQLSKSLSESASDLVDIKTTLLEKTRDSEALLLQLSRTQAELQNGLMDSRMVPFSRLLPRLQRILRQTASELNKVVELDVINADDEIDRTILDRITSPLEHMLRNAVDHGVETPDQRVAAGKPRAGQIKLEVMREGSEIVIHLTDDGNGIDIEAVRAKAISQGLIDPNDTSLTDMDVMQYIFNAGLTTTKKVTQISGRGVGMDVVRSEIRQLGGVVAVDSVEGGGSRFTIRVPLTVAVSDALVVRAADRYYAIPLVQIERVVRVSPEELHTYYQSEDTTLMIENKDYRVRYLNEILSGHTFNEMLMMSNSSLPVIIIKSQTGQSIAMQVDEIAGSRIEVVVKPLGRQLAQLPGISAATIMGDGSVMLILDMVALMHTAQAKPQVLQQPVSEIQAIAVDTQTTVLVVDDSVTVRKVTSRFLERQGMRAVVAKDGIDAIEILQDLTPDIILLDIEMPRMDGFEVATQVRHQRRLKDIPIIMITSRTGEKHRERAMEIGVNDYMGKPFQEDELLERIDELLGERDLAANGSSSLKQGSAATQTGGHHDG